MRRGSVPTVAHTFRVHRLANQPVKGPVNRAPSPISRSLCRNSIYAETHEDASCVRRPRGMFAVLACLFTWSKSELRPKAVRTRNRRHFSQKCPTGIERYQRASLETRFHPQAVKCRRRYVGSGHSALHSAQKYFFRMVTPRIVYAASSSTPRSEAKVSCERRICTRVRNGNEGGRSS